MTDRNQKIKLSRPITVEDLYRTKFNVLPFSGAFKQLMGQPEVLGSWLIFGYSTQGKTRFILQLAKYMANFGKVFINSLEEGKSESIKQGFIAERMEDVRNRVYLLDREPLEHVKERLRRRNAPDFVFFDSVQFMQEFTIDDYIALLDEFAHKNKLFVFTSHAKGKEPKGSVADAIYYRSFVKLRVDGYRVFPQSRYGGNHYYDIWPEKAQAYHL